MNTTYGAIAFVVVLLFVVYLNVRVSIKMRKKAATERYITSDAIEDLHRRISRDLQEAPERPVTIFLPSHDWATFRENREKNGLPMSYLGIPVQEGPGVSITFSYSGWDASPVRIANPRYTCGQLVTVKTQSGMGTIVKMEFRVYKKRLVPHYLVRIFGQATEWHPESEVTEVYAK